MPTQHKATRTSTISIQMKTQNCFDSNLAYMDHSLPPLGLFLQIKLNFLSLSQIHLKRHKDRYSKRNWSRISKTPPFSHNQHFSPQGANFWQERQQESFSKPKVIFYYFQNFSSGSWSISCFGLIFSPFGIKHQNGINFGPLTPLPHQNLQIRIQRQ
jgi:hypothetical protein